MPFCSACGFNITDPEAQFCRKCGKPATADRNNGGYDVIVENGALVHVHSNRIGRLNEGESWKEENQMMQLVENSILEVCLWKHLPSSFEPEPMRWPSQVPGPLQSKGMCQNMWATLRERLSHISRARGSIKANARQLPPMVCIVGFLGFVLWVVLMILGSSYWWIGLIAWICCPAFALTCERLKQAPIIQEKWNQVHASTLEAVADSNKDMQGLNVAMGIASIHKRHQENIGYSYRVHRGRVDGDVCVQHLSTTVHWEVVIFYPVSVAPNITNPPKHVPERESSLPPYMANTADQTSYSLMA